MAPYQRNRHNTDEEAAAESGYTSEHRHHNDPDEDDEDEANVSTTVQKIAQQSFWKQVAINGLLIAAW